MRAIVWLLLGLFVSIGSRAWIPTIVNGRCPIGDGWYTTAGFGPTDWQAYANYGDLPDGSSKRNWPPVTPLVLPTCDANGLVVYRTFSEDEKLALPAIIVDPRYRTLVYAGQRYFPAYLIEQQLAPYSDMTAELLLRASWEVRDEPELKKRYQALFLAQVRTTIERRGLPTVRSLRMAAYAANVHRELGQLNAARDMLKRLPQRGYSLCSSAEPFGSAKFETDRMRREVAQYVAALSRAIDRGDTSAEPTQWRADREAFARVDCVR